MPCECLVKGVGFVPCAAIPRRYRYGKPVRLYLQRQGDCIYAVFFTQKNKHLPHQHPLYILLVDPKTTSRGQKPTSNLYAAYASSTKRESSCAASRTVAIAPA